MEPEHKPSREHQRRLNDAMREVVKKEVLKLLHMGIIYPVQNSEWVSLVQVVSKKGGMTVVQNERNELIPQKTVTGWRMCIDYRILNKATRKRSLPTPLPTPRSSTSRWPWSPHPSHGSKAWRESIHSWEDLKKAFVDNFQGSLSRVATRHALSMIMQEQGESIRSYVKRFFDTRATIPNIADDDVIDYFQSSITVQSLYRDFGRNHPKTVVELRDMMQRWADEEEQERNRFPCHNNDKNGKSNNDRGGPVTSGILRASASQTTPSALWIAPRAVRK